MTINYNWEIGKNESKLKWVRIVEFSLIVKLVKYFE